ncbi:MAG: hypothetical protein KKH91_01055 [Elusimicrobia bacterium]|nr:hypothetical protein [Elusimicrobiota bacterium]MBU2615068.1 hypothetical protein [Elusimicrobiota bacterium]
MIVEFTTFKERPVIQLKRDENDRYGLSMGLSKAKLCIEAIEEIKKFVKDNDVPVETEKKK